MPGSIRSMHVEHVFRDVQTDRGSLLHGRLLRWQFDTATLAHRCRRGASTPSPITVEYSGLVTVKSQSCWSWGTNCLNHCSFPVLASSTTIAAVYRFFPIRTPPKKSGAGLPT